MKCTTMNNTVKQWLEALQEPHRTDALALLDPAVANDQVDAQSQALKIAFSWPDSPQGREHWLRVTEAVVYMERMNKMRGY